MYIKTETTIIFKMPEEYLIMESFKSGADNGRWKESQSTEYVTFTRCDCNMTRVGENDALD